MIFYHLISCVIAAASLWYMSEANKYFGYTVAILTSLYGIGVIVDRGKK